MGCGIAVEVKNGKISKISGDMEHPGCHGKLCPKAFSIPEIVYSEERLKMPLIRKTRGGTLQEASWEEALEFAAERLTQIRNQYGPKSLIRCNGAPVNYQCRDGYKQFMKLYGSDNETGASNICSVSRGAAYNAVYGARPEPDPYHTNLMIYWGSNPFASHRTGSFCAFDMPDSVIKSIKARGVKIVVVDPVYSEIAQYADEWIDLRCGTDSALLLAMMNYIISNDLYDHEFVENYSVGFDRLAEHVKSFAPEWAAEITGLSAERICAFAREYALARPASISAGNGTDMYTNVCDTTRCIAMLEGMCGYVDVLGGAMFLPHITKNKLGMTSMADRFGKEKYPLFPEVSFSHFKEALLAGDPQCPKAMIVEHGNPVLVQANSKRTREALEKLKLIIVSDIFMTATAEIADIVFPDTSPFERWSYKTYSSYERPFAVCGRPIADPPGQARSSCEVERELAAYMKLEGDYPFQNDIEQIDYMLQPTGITFEKLEAEQYCFADMHITERKYRKQGFFPDGGKLRFYSEDYEKAGYPPMPIYRDPAGGLAHISEEYPLLCTSRRPGEFVHTKLHNTSATTRLHPFAELWISRADAETRGLSDGDFAVLKTEIGQEKFCIHIACRLPVGLVAAEFGWGNPTDHGPDMNRVTNDHAWDPISGSTPNRLFVCQVEKCDT